MNTAPTYARPFSYVDSACSFAYFNLIPDNLATVRGEIQGALQLRDTERDKSIRHLQSIILKLLFSEFRSTFFHEWHHCLQAIFYPYRYLQSWRELKVALDGLSNLRKSKDRLRLGELDFPTTWRDTVVESSMVYGVNVQNGILIPVDRDPQDLRPNDFTLTDLIEEATCIFQFKVETEQEGDGASYHQWTRAKRSAYSNVFRLLSKLMGIEGAYVALPPLVQACFSTTWPGPSFINLVNLTIQKGSSIKPEELGCDKYYRCLLEILKTRHATVNGCLPDSGHPNESDEFYYLDQAAYKTIANDTPKHVVHPLAKRYIELSATIPNLNTFLFHPNHPQLIPMLDNEFRPPLTIIRLHNLGLLARDSLLIVSNALKDRLVPVELRAPLGITFSAYLPEVMKRKDIAYSLFTDLNDYLEHNCHHHDCPYHPTNVCRRWSAIPEDWSKCPFPGWFRTVTGRSINHQSRELEIVNP